MTPEPLVPRLVLITLACGHTVTLGIPPEVDPPPGYILHCYDCEMDMPVLSVVPHSSAAGAAPDAGADADAATRAANTPVLHSGDTL